MNATPLTIEREGTLIPALLWGRPAGRLLLAVHGAQADKSDPTIAAAAGVAAAAGMATLSFDLPGHGQRKEDGPLLPWNAVEDIRAAYRHACTLADEVWVFGCSLGAFFSMVALDTLPDSRPPARLLMLSPVVDMEALLGRMMAAAGVTEERLAREQVIPVPGGEDLRWDYYTYIKAHPVTGLPCQADILRGEKDGLVPAGDIEAFAGRTGARVSTVPEGEHWFHTPDQMAALTEWLARAMDATGVDELLLLAGKGGNPNAGCDAARQLAEISAVGPACYSALPTMAAMVNHKNSYVRNRGLALLAANARWDEEGRYAAILPGVFAHITDEKPITARQCIKALGEIAAARPGLARAIADALSAADFAPYKDSMRPLLEQDRAAVLASLPR